MNEKELLTGEVRKILPGGEALVHAPSGSYLIANVLPDESVEFIALPSRRGVKRGELNRLVSASSHRVEPICSVAGQCGGCAFQYLAPAEQCTIKSSWVHDAFAECIDDGTIFQPVTDSPIHARRRLRWYVDHGKIGFRARASHQVVTTEACPAITDVLNRLRDQLQHWLNENSFPSITSIQALQLSDGVHLVIESGDQLSIEPPFDLVEQLPVQCWSRCGAITRPLTKPVSRFHDLLPVGTAELPIAIGPDDFVQGQVAGNRYLISKVVEWSAGARRVVDLFSGVGNLSLPVAAAHGADVSGAEVNEASVRAANSNAKALDLKAAYHVHNLFGDFPIGEFAGADVLILDPPRKGAKAICKKMGSLLPGKIIMVNCDIAAGSRDAKELKEAGFKMQELHALDLFPYAGHVEALSLWVR